MFVFYLLRCYNAVLRFFMYLFPIWYFINIIDLMFINFIDINIKL